MIPISVCIIAKNEEKTMEDFLIRLRKYDWEIIVVDTGSTDHTKDIALKYADKVVDFKWIDDFSAARNFSVEQASFDQILYLDCDELLSQINMDEILSEMEKHPFDLGRITINNHLIINDILTFYPIQLERFFRKDTYYFDLSIHEQLIRRDKAETLSYDIPLTVDHVGYQLTDEEKQTKADRNNKLLFKELKKHPKDAYINFQIGQSFFLIDNYESALQYYGAAITCPNFNPSLLYSLSLVQAYGECLLQTNREKEALSLVEIQEFFDEFADFHCLLGRIYFANKEPLKSMMEFIKATQALRSFTSGSKDNIPYFNMGCINEILGNTEGALQQFKRCENFPKADDKIKELQNKLL